jgi:alpha-tubulin suppressor-like RCC1 family protein
MACNTIALRGAHTSVIDKNGVVWSFGCNLEGKSAGWLGIGGPPVARNPTPTQVNAPIPFQQVGTGGYYTVFLDVEGKVWHAGNLFPTNDISPRLCFDKIPIIHITAGGSFFLAIDNENNVWSFGNNRKGQLGLGHRNAVNELTQITEFPEPIRTLSCGYDFTLALAASGSVYAFGDNDYGQLGLGHKRTQDLPEKIPYVSRVELIATGYRHSLVVDNEDQVWVFGNNQYRQLGVLTTKTVLIPTRNNTLSDNGIIAIAGGHSHSAAVDKEGSLWVFGYNTEGQLGIVGGSFIGIPEKNPYFEDAQNVFCSQHTIVLSKTGALFGFGKNNFGQLGLGSVSELICGLKETCGFEI